MTLNHLFIYFNLKGAMAATYRAITQTPRAPNLGPVHQSELAARRRWKLKSMSSSEK